MQIVESVIEEINEINKSVINNNNNNSGSNNMELEKND